MERCEIEFKNYLIIIILRFEYDYLSRYVFLVEEIVEKKVVVVEVWVEVFRVSIKVVLMKMGILMRESGMMRVEEEREVFRIERMKRLVEDEIYKFKWILEVEVESYFFFKLVRKLILV